VKAQGVTGNILYGQADAIDGDAVAGLNLS